MNFDLNGLISTFVSSPWFVILVVALLVVFIQKGWFNFTSDKLQIGKAAARDGEREIIAKQMNYVALHLEAQQNIFLKKHCDEYKIEPYALKYAIERAFDEFCRRIAVNHINNSSIYVDDTSQAILLQIQRSVENDYFYSEEFTNFIHKEVEDIINHLLKIRKTLVVK